MDADTPRPTVVDCRAPRHRGGSTRVLLSPGAVSVGGTNGHSVVLLRLGRPTGAVDPMFRGTSLHGAVEVATGTIRDRRPDAVWITDRSYLRRHWSPWTVRRTEVRLAAAARRVDAPLLTWTGAAGESGSEPVGYAEA